MFCRFQIHESVFVTFHFQFLWLNFLLSRILLFVGVGPCAYPVYGRPQGAPLQTETEAVPVIDSECFYRESRRIWDRTPDPFDMAQGRGEQHSRTTIKTFGGDPPSAQHINGYRGTGPEVTRR